MHYISRISLHCSPHLKPEKDHVGNIPTLLTCIGNDVYISRYMYSSFLSQVQPGQFSVQILKLTCIGNY